MGRRGRPTREIILSAEERSTLQRWAQRHSSSQALALRSKIVLACAQGELHGEIAAQLGCHPTTVGKWRQRFAVDRLDGLIDAPRPGAARTIGDDVIEAVIVETLETAPPDATHWSTRGLAAKHGISHTTVGEIWRAFGLKPWREDSFKVSPDPDLVEKIRDLVALYMNPPVAAAVFAIDEKPQIQALNRTAPTLPMLPTTPARATHDYRRNGTCDLFAALEIATGKVITDIRPRHTSRLRCLLEQGQPQRARRPRRARHLGQPFRPQNPDRAALAATPQTLPPALHSHLRVLDEPRRAMVQRAHHQEAAALRPPVGQRTRGRYPSVGRSLERQPHAIRVAQDRRPDPRTPRRVLRCHQPTTQPITTLISQRFNLPRH